MKLMCAPRYNCSLTDLACKLAHFLTCAFCLVPGDCVLSVLHCILFCQLLPNQGMKKRKGWAGTGWCVAQSKSTTYSPSQYLLQFTSRPPLFFPSHLLTSNLQSQTSQCQCWGRSPQSHQQYTFRQGKEWQRRCEHASPQLFQYRSPFPSLCLCTPSISIEKLYRVRNNCLIVYHEDYWFWLKCVACNKAEIDWRHCSDLLLRSNSIQLHQHSFP